MNGAFLTSLLSILLLLGNQGCSTFMQQAEPEASWEKVAETNCTSSMFKPIVDLAVIGGLVASSLGGTIIFGNPLSGVDLLISGGLGASSYRGFETADQCSRLKAVIAKRKQVPLTIALERDRDDGSA